MGAAPSGIEERDGAKPKKFPPGTITPKEGTPQDSTECACGCGHPVGRNNEQLEQVHPKAVSAMRDLQLGYRVEGIVSRRWEAKRCKDAHLAYMGIQNGYYNAADWQWHMPFGTSVGLGLGVEDSDEDYESPTYDYVTNYYQAYELAFEAIMTAKIPTPKFMPASAQDEQDITTAKAADDVRKLNEKNNPPKKLLRRFSWLGWCDGKIGWYVRYVADGQRFGFDEISEVGEDVAKIGEDGYACPDCGSENPMNTASPDNAGFCQECGKELSQDDFKMAEYAPVPTVTGSKKVPKGQVVISCIPGLEFHTPPWANERHEFPYLQWNLETHKAKLKAAYPHAADKITSGGPVSADDAQLRVWRLQVAQGFPVQMPGDALANLVTFSRSWIRPWAFWEIDDTDVRNLLLKLFPDGCYAAFAGEAYCESRNESMDKHFRVTHMLEGDGQNRPGVGDSSLQVNKQANDLGNIEQEAADYGIPITLVDAELLKQDQINQNKARPGDIISVKTRPNAVMSNQVFQTAAVEVPAAWVARRQELLGPQMQFLTGIQPSAFGADLEGEDTKGAYLAAREQAMGRIGLFYHEMALGYGEAHLLAVRCYAENATADQELPTEQEGGGWESKYIRLAELQGEIELYEEPDESFPALPSEVRVALEKVLADPTLGPMFLQSPANVTRAKDTMGLSDFVAPGEDMRTKTMRIIRELLKSGPVQPPPQMAQGPMGPAAQQQPPQPTIMLDEMLDDPTVAMAECRRWFQSDAGQEQALDNPNGVANVRAFFAHCMTIAKQQAAAMGGGDGQKPPSESINYKDLTPGGKVQMASQAGIKENPAELAQKAAAGPPG